MAAGPKKGPNGIANEPDVAHVTLNDTALYVFCVRTLSISFQLGPVCRYDPLLTYGIITRPQVPPFRPKFVLNDNIVLTFSGFFRQHIVEPNRSYDRIRYVNVMYFMEDDTITVMEPPVIVRAQRFHELFFSIPIKLFTFIPFRIVAARRDALSDGLGC